MHHHRTNSGSRLLRAVNLAGIKWKVVRTWEERDGNFERELKNRKSASFFCPICSVRDKKKKAREAEKRKRLRDKKRAKQLLLNQKISHDIKKPKTHRTNEAVRQTAATF